MDGRSPGCGFTSLLDFRIASVFCTSSPDPGIQCSWKTVTRLTSTREYCASCLLTPETLGSGELLFRILSLRKIKSSGFIQEIFDGSAHIFDLELCDAISE